MEFKYEYLFLLGLVLAIVWSLDFWKVFNPSRLFYIKREKKNDVGNLLRLLIFSIGILGIGYLSYSLTFPRKPQSFSPNTKEVNDIFLVIDVSRSMLAEDLSPNRLEVAKKKLREFAALRPKDRIGVIVFSEKVFTLLPLTTDASLINRVMGQISVGQLGSGTNIGDALGLAVARAEASETKNKIIVLLTDGVNNVGTLTPIESAEKAKEFDIKVYTIGLGSDRDARIPVGKGIFGTHYQRIPGGSIDMKTLEEISKMTGGISFRAQDENSLKDILIEIEKLERTEIKVQSQVIYEELYYEYLFWGLILFGVAEASKRFFLKEVV